MKKLVLLTIALILVAGSASAQFDGVVGSKHDLSANLPTSQRVCVFCHTPHQPTGITTDPLWNHELSTQASYNVYDSTTFDGAGTIADIGGAATVSNLCMSCHDGTIGIGSLENNPNIATGEEIPTNVGTMMTGNALLGVDLSNDHPINFTFDAALVTADTTAGQPGLNDPTVPPVSDLLFGGTVQCASCHNPHNEANIPFLRISNINSGLCTTCHIK